MKFHILTLFPEFFESSLKSAIIYKAIQKSLLQVDLVDIKKFTEGGRADDYPFGGGDGMILRYSVLQKALHSVSSPGRIIYLSAQGEKWSAKKAKDYAQKYSGFTFVCGRYSGVDARFVQDFADEEISIGDYILNGGESASLVLIESLSRFIPGFLGNEESHQKESFENSLLEGPYWTRPRDIKGHKLPELIFNGHHKEIEKLRFYTSLILTYLKRPDLLEGKTELLKQIPSAKQFLFQIPSEELKSLGLYKEKEQLFLWKKGK